MSHHTTCCKLIDLFWIFESYYMILNTIRNVFWFLFSPAITSLLNSCLPFFVFRYENLVLVAGGIGISPFLAILSDILHRSEESKPCTPRNVLIIWAVKRSEELPLLHSLDLNSLFPDFYTKLNLEIQTYVTQESEPPVVRIPVFILHERL